MNGKLDRQLVISIIGRTWDKQIATYPSQLDGPPKGGPADSYMYTCTYIYRERDSGRNLNAYQF